MTGPRLLLWAMLLADACTLAASGLARERQLQVPSSIFFENAPKIMQDRYIHTQYEFQLNRPGMPRSGEGELWLSFEDGLPRIRLEGIAHSPKFGRGSIKLFLDSATKYMYAQVDLKDMHEHQCIKYPFPDPEDPQNSARLQTLNWRKEQVNQWQTRESKQWGEQSEMASVNWTKSYTLGFMTSKDSREVLGVKLHQGERVVKSVHLMGTPDRADHVPEEARKEFIPPADCRLPAMEGEHFATLNLKPPHQQSSALNDLLLMLTSSEPVVQWSQLYLILSSIILPGDVAVILENPEPPAIDLWERLAFDYKATTAGPMHHVSTSRGSIWVDLEERAFRLNGHAKGTKVGDLEIDLIARGGSGAKIYAHVKLLDQDEQQCLSYEYPLLTDHPLKELQENSKLKFTFFSISEFNGEDCSIFVAPLARDRSIHVWVDLEADNPQAFLRTEIHHNQKVLRSTDVLQWRTGEDIRMKTMPEAGWDCDHNSLSGQLAHLDIRSMHKKSIQLQDALYSLHELSPDFALREILGLTGDVAIVVKVPHPPELSQMPSATFAFSSLPIGGEFAIDVPSGRVRATASSESGPSERHITLALDLGKALAVKIEDPMGEAPTRCLKLSLEELDFKSEDLIMPAVGEFDQVDAIGASDCNHFRYYGNGGHLQSIDFWYSEEDDSLCRFELKPRSQGSSTSDTVRFEFPTFLPLFEPGPSSAPFKGKQDTWAGCQSADPSGGSWLRLASSSQKETSDLLPGARKLIELGEALGTVGLLPPEAATTLARMIVEMPSDKTSPGPRQDLHPSHTWQNDDIRSPLLKSFTFSFSSTYPLQGEPPGEGSSGIYGRTMKTKKSGMGEVRVDLENRLLYMRSEAKNLSDAIGMMESKVIYRADQGRLWARTKIMGAEEFQQCWQISTAEILPVPPRGLALNPFLRGKHAGNGFSVPGNLAHAHALADKFVFFISTDRRVELYVDDQKALAYISVDHLDHDVSAGVKVHDWSTAPIDQEWFKPGADWGCQDVQLDHYSEMLADWDLIQIFLPTEPDEWERRLNLV